MDIIITVEEGAEAEAEVAAEVEAEAEDHSLDLALLPEDHLHHTRKIRPIVVRTQEQLGRATIRGCGLV